MPDPYSPGPIGGPGSPARIVEPLEQCLLHGLRARRGGWSSQEHLVKDLEHLFGVRASATTLQRALRELGKRRRVHILLDDEGVVWYRITPDSDDDRAGEN